jgi:hypothetical protein
MITDQVRNAGSGVGLHGTGSRKAGERSLTQPPQPAKPLRCDTFTFDYASLT